MIETKYICDRCGAVQDTVEQFWNVRVQVNIVNSSFSDYDTGPKKQWCRKCVEEIGILPRPSNRPVSFPVMTIEDMIREIVHEEREE